jgi:hypothetical protein
MALDRLIKIDGGGISTTSDYRVGVITASKFIGPFDGTAGNFSGIITASGANFSGNVTIGGTLTYEDVTNIDSVGIITGKGADINGDLDVDGHTNLDNISVAGVSTFAGNADFSSGIDVTGNITATGQLFSSYATLSAVNPTLTFADTDNNPDYTINLNSGILKITDSTNTADRIVVNSTGVSIPNDLDVDGHTNLDNVSVAGVTTFSDSDIFFKNNGITSCRFDSNRGAFDFNHQGGLFWYKNGNLSNSSGATIFYSEFANQYKGLVIQAPWQGQTNAKNVTVMGSSNGRFVIQSNLNASETFRANFEGGVNLGYYQSGTKLSTTTTGIRLYQDLTVDRNALITGISTFTGAIDANGDLDVDGHTNLDNVNVAGVSTFSGVVSGVQVNLQSAGGELINVSSTNAASRSTIKFNTNGNDYEIGARGSSADHPNNFYIFDNNATSYRMLINSNGAVSILGDLDVDGHTNLDNVSIAGVVTATAFVSTAGQLSNRNKIQNGAMNVSQRFDGDAHTPSSTSRIYTLDRWAYWSNQASKTTIQQVEDAPVGFKYSSKCTVASAYSIASGDWFGYMTHIEGQDLYDLELGNSNAKAFTLSFYVKSSVAGTWAGSIRTKGSSPDHSYPYNYTINSANTWEKKTITVPGPTSGTWVGGRSEGMCVWFDLGSGSAYHSTANQWASANRTGPSSSPFIANAGATWQITGVQLEKGSAATEYEHRSAADETSICERYCEVMYGTNIEESNEATMGIGHFYQSSRMIANYQFHTQKRVGHNGETSDYGIRNTGGYVKGDVADVQALYSGASWHGANSVKFRMNRTACRVDLRGLGGTQGHAAEWRIQNNTKLIFSAEFG